MARTSMTGIARWVALCIALCVASEAHAERECVARSVAAIGGELWGRHFLVEGEDAHLILRLPRTPGAHCVGILAVGAPNQRVGLAAFASSGEARAADGGPEAFAWLRACGDAGEHLHVSLRAVRGSGEVVVARTLTPPEDRPPLASSLGACTQAPVGLRPEPIDPGPAPAIEPRRWNASASQALADSGWTRLDDRFELNLEETRSERLEVDPQRCVAVSIRTEEGRAYARVESAEGTPIARGRGDVRFCTRFASVVVHVDSGFGVAAVEVRSAPRPAATPVPEPLIVEYLERIHDGALTPLGWVHVDPRHEHERELRLEVGCHRAVALGEGVRVGLTLLEADGTRRAQDAALNAAELVSCVTSPTTLRLRLTAEHGSGTVWLGWGSI